ncbi:MAG TPA: hypothetical protein VEC35_17145 [Noviherbaspirillum sp.]|nr:hypothetical protein [Noviherbaspirillum sp.]
MHIHNEAINAVHQEFEIRLADATDEELSEFLALVRWLVRLYESGYELGHPLFLVVDNSILQDFKQGHKRGRAIRALAYIALCRFIALWSDRKTCLALSPMAVYEAGGRKPADSVAEAWERFEEAGQLLAETELPVTGVRFTDPKMLYESLLDIHDDADYLAVFAAQIEEMDWRHDLRMGNLLRIPHSLAMEYIPGDMPLKYFNPFYVTDVFSSRIELRIAKQSAEIGNVKPVTAGSFSVAMDKLIKLEKKGALKGLGDLDLLQICDIRRQYHQKQDYIFLGQTYDRGLADVMNQHHVYSCSASAKGGEPDTDEQIRKMVQLMFSKPFQEIDRTREQIQPRSKEFLGCIFDVCANLSRRRQG